MVTAKRVRRCEVEVYIAKDGKEFETPEACLMYEREEERKADWLNVIRQMPELSGKRNFDGQEFLEGNDFHWYFPRSNAEVDALNDIYKGVCVGYDAVEKWICIESSDDFSYCTYLDDGIVYVSDILKKLGYTVTITPPQA